MKITKDYLRTVIKEELERLEEGTRHGQVYFDNMATAMFNGANVDLENLAHQITQVGKLKQGQEVQITMDQRGIKWNGKLVAKGDDEKAAADFAHKIKAKVGAASQQTQAATTPAKWNPSMGTMKSV